MNREYDQVWDYKDFDYLCGLLDSTTVLASAPQAGENVDGIWPGCIYAQEATFTNNLPYPVTVHYTGYTDEGEIAPYISGTLCDSALIPRHLSNTLGKICNEGDWVGDIDITLQPGQTSAPFTMLVGMPWFIGNESKGTSGTFTFKWDVIPAGPPPPPPTPAQPPSPIPTLGNWAWIVLTLGMAGIGAHKIRRKVARPRRQP